MVLYGRKYKNRGIEFKTGSKIRKEQFFEIALNLRRSI